MANVKYINENFDLQGLLEIGFLENITDYEYIEKRICKWFNLQYIQQYSDIMQPKPKILKADNIFSDN